MKSIPSSSILFTLLTPALAYVSVLWTSQNNNNTSGILMLYAIGVVCILTLISTKERNTFERLAFLTSAALLVISPNKSAIFNFEVAIAVGFTLSCINPALQIKRAFDALYNILIEDTYPFSQLSNQK